MRFHTRPHPATRRFERQRAAALRDGPAAGGGRLARWAAWIAYRLDPPPRKPGTTHHRPPNPVWHKHDRDPDRDRRREHVKWASGLVGALVAAWFWAPGGALVAVAAVVAWWALVPRAGPIRPRRLTVAGWAAVTIAVVAAAGMVRAGVTATTPVRVGVFGAGSTPVGPFTLDWPGVPALTRAFVPVAVLAWAGIGLWVAAWVCRHVLGWTPDVIADAITGGRAVAVVADVDPGPAAPTPDGSPVGDPFAFLDYDDPPDQSEIDSGATETDDRKRHDHH